MKASNSNKNLKGTDRDEVVANTANPILPVPLEVSAAEVVQEESQGEQGYTESFFVTRQEWNDLLERIAKHNRQSPHPF